MSGPHAATTVSDALAAGATCYGVGDPHYKSFDGSYFDFYGKGQFYLVKSNQLQIQTLLTQLPSNSYVSFHTGVAFAGSAMRGSTLQVLGGAGGLGVSPRPTRVQHAVAMLLVHSKGRSRRSRFFPPYGTALVVHPDQRLELHPRSAAANDEHRPDRLRGKLLKERSVPGQHFRYLLRVGRLEAGLFAPSSFNVVSQPQHR